MTNDYGGSEGMDVVGGEACTRRVERRVDGEVYGGNGRMG